MRACVRLIYSLPWEYKQILPGDSNTVGWFDSNRIICYYTLTDTTRCVLCVRIAHLVRISIILIIGGRGLGGRWWYERARRARIRSSVLSHTGIRLFPEESCLFRIFSIYEIGEMVFHDTPSAEGVFIA